MKITDPMNLMKLLLLKMWNRTSIMKVSLVYGQLIKRPNIVIVSSKLIYVFLLSNNITFEKGGHL